MLLRFGVSDCLALRHHFGTSFALMKGMELRGSLFISLVLISAALSGCGQVVSDTVNRSGEPLSGALAPAGGGFNTNCSTGVSAIGSVFGNGSNGMSFEQAVQGLVSATLDPRSLGAVSGERGSTNGVQLRLFLKRTSNYSASSDSRIELRIVDSYTGTKDSSGKLIQAYPIVINGASQAIVDSTRQQFNITFADSYGKVQVIGWWNQQLMSGTISYENSRHATGGVPASGLLGSFELPTCGVFQ